MEENKMIYLIENMVKRGTTLQDIFKKIDFSNKGDTFEIKNKIKEIFDKEMRLAANDKKIMEVCNILKNQSVADGKTNRILQEFRINQGEIRKGYVTNLYYLDTIKENPGIMFFLFNRVKRLYCYSLKGYNKEYLQRREKEFSASISKYNKKVEPNIDDLNLEDILL